MEKNDELKPSAKRTSVAVAISGNVDSGKSTFIGVMTSGVLDDGNGSARKLVAKHLHEIVSGKTSDISCRIYDLPSNEAITLVDLCGHESYFKTTAHGVSGTFPDFAMLIVSANRSVQAMTKQHMRLLLSLSIPIVLIITHIDITPPNIYKQTCTAIEKTCALYGGRSVSVNFVNNIDDQTKTEEELTIMKEKAVESILSSILNITDGKQTTFPVVSISNKTGFFIDVVREIMPSLKPRHFWSPGGEESVMNNKVVKHFRFALEKQKLGMSSIMPKYKEFSGGIFYTDSCYNPPGIGLVVSGINRGDNIDIGSVMYLGPFGKSFYKIRVKSLHNNMRQHVQSLHDHDRGCVNFSIMDKDKVELKREQINRGAILLSSPELAKNVCYRFKAVIKFFTSSITVKAGYSPMIHLYTVRQAARITFDPAENNTSKNEKGEDIIMFDGKSDSVAVVTLKFKQNPEFVEPYNLFILRSADIQGVGIVTEIVPLELDDDAKPDPVKVRKFIRRKAHRTEATNSLKK